MIRDLKEVRQHVRRKNISVETQQFKGPGVSKYIQ